jgi:predicted transcriptional regulator
MTETRARLYRHIESNPGVHFRELTRALDLATGQVQYHLSRLESVTSERVNGRTHYYVGEFDDWERTAYALLRRETARDVVASLLARETARPDDVASELGIARSTLEHHLDSLVEAEIVEKRRDGNCVTLALCRPAATADALRTVDPSLADRFADRFQRLFDDFFEA